MAMSIGCGTNCFPRSWPRAFERFVRRFSALVRCLHDGGFLKSNLLCQIMHPVVDKCLRDLNVDSRFVGIDGTLYDVDQFATCHPGGALLLAICKGKDATALFETHHIDIAKARRALASLPRRGSYTQRVEYDFASYAVLRANMLMHFPTASSRRMDKTSTKAALCAYVVLALVLHGWVISQDRLFTYEWILACVTSSICNAVCGGFGHNALHRVELPMILLDWNGLSAYEWLLEHVQSHHMHVNDSQRDHDVVAMQPFLNWRPTTRAAWLRPWCGHAVYAIAEVIVAIQGNFGHRVRWKLPAEAPLWLHLTPLLFVARVFSHFVVAPFYVGTISLLSCLMLSGYMFAYLAHLNHANPDGNESASADFVIRQLAHTRDLDVPERLAHLFLYLDRQTLHHLFPTLDHSRLLLHTGSTLMFPSHRHTIGMLDQRSRDALKAHATSQRFPRTR